MTDEWIGSAYIGSDKRRRCASPQLTGVKVMWPNHEQSSTVAW
jgi:hypothetical protein